MRHIVGQKKREKEDEMRFDINDLNSLVFYCRNWKTAKKCPDYFGFPKRNYKHCKLN